jgi:geranylgeranyl pyrophosphate synthase
MRLETTMRRDAARCERTLQRLLAARRPRIPTRLADAMEYALFPGGKRIRPILMFAAGEAVGERRGRLAVPACAVEVLHNYSLIHDDLPAMDNDDTRRGRPTVHRRFDEATAVLAGDALLTLSFELLAGAPALDDAARVAVLRLFARYTGAEGLIGGQQLDMDSAGNGGRGQRPEAARLIQAIHRGKTGRLIEACIVIPGIIAGVDERHHAVLRRAGAAIGMLFQITDDLLDAGQPGEEGKLTYPAVYGVEVARRLVGRIAIRTDRLLERCFGDRAAYLRGVTRLIVERTR